MKRGEVTVWMTTASVSTMSVAEDTDLVAFALVKVGGAHGYPVAKEDLAEWTSKRRQQYVEELRRSGLSVYVVDNRKKSPPPVVMMEPSPTIH